MDLSERVSYSLLMDCIEGLSLSEIVQKSHGADPSYILQIIGSLLNEGSLTVTSGKYYTQLDHDEISHLSDVERNLPIPHPLDYEWRFSFSTLFLLKHIIQKNNFRRILLIGTPSVYAALKPLMQTLEFTLLDKNELMCNTLKNIFKGYDNSILIVSVEKYIRNAEDQYDLVIIDPPWYDTHFKNFLLFSALSLRKGGNVLVSYPQGYTRPKVTNDKFSLYNFASKIGLSLDGVINGLGEYQSPFFEYNSFATSGKIDFSPFWRKSDFLCFTKKSDDSELFKMISPNESESNWIEFQLKTCRVRILNEEKTSKSRGLFLTRLIKNDIVDNVSIRNKVRGRVNVWTSGNRVFRVNNTQKLISSLQEFPSNQEGIESFSLSCNFEMILQSESSEYQLYKEWIDHGMAKRVTERR